MIGMVRTKSKKKKGQRTNLPKTRKKSSGVKKKATAKSRKNDKKNTTKRKRIAPRTKARRVKAVSSPAAFTEIASEEMTSATTPTQGGQDLPGSTESTEVDRSEFT